MRLGDKVYHRKDPGLQGVIVDIDPGPDDDRTRACKVQWYPEDPENLDTQWVYKLRLLEGL